MSLKQTQTYTEAKMNLRTYWPRNDFVKDESDELLVDSSSI
jgi:hypothetical protein